MLVRLTTFLLAAAVLASSDGAWAQVTAVDVGVQARDILPESGGDFVYAAVFDRNEVWKLRRGEKDPVAKVSVGKGPVALALSSDGAILACANSLSGTVSFMKLADFGQTEAPFATVEAPKGVSILAALSGNRFAAAGHFADSVTVIDATAASASPTTFKVGAAIEDMAASGDLLAVTCGMPTVVQVFTADAFKPIALIQLNGRPANVVAMRDGVFAVSLPSRIVAVDATKHEVVAEAAVVAKDLAFDGTRLLALEEKAVAAFDQQLTLTARMALDTPATVLRASADTVTLLAAKTRQIFAGPFAPSEEIVAAKGEQPESEEGRKPLWRRGQKPPSATAKAEASGTYAHVPGGELEMGAPSPQVAPSGTPLFGAKRKSLTGALTDKFDFSPQEAFQPPDWRQPLRDVEGDNMVISERGLSGKNLRLRLGTMDFSADEFTQDQATGEMHAAGNVMMWQTPSLFSADEVTYRVPEEAAGASLLRPLMSDDESEKRRMGSGMIDASNALIIQPTQELSARQVSYDIANATGELEDARGRAGIYYFGAKKLRILGPASVDGEDIWVTTCDHDPPHYRLRVKKFAVREGVPVYAQSSQLQLGSVRTPLYWPVWGNPTDKGGMPMSFDFVAGHRAHIGYFVNTGQQFNVTPDVKLGLRLYPTTSAGVGIGVESDYDFMKTPSSPLFLSKGTFRSLWTTDDEGYLELRHRHEIYDDTVLLLNVEHWSDEQFYKDFFYDQYKNRTGPRTFANVTYTQPEYIASGTVRVDTTDFTHETERLPELSYHLLERELFPNLYFAFDTVDGYNKREPRGAEGLRLLNVGRFTYDINLDEALSITPFAELEATYYSLERDDDSDGSRLAATTGVTVQTRLHKAYPGALGFSGFKHVVLPSLTLSHRPESSFKAEDAPRFDSYDALGGRTRLETKLDNVIYGRDTATEKVWQVARLTLTYGYDYWNEARPARDYGAEFDVRPRPYYGWLLKAQHHSIDDDFARGEVSYYKELFMRAYERFYNRPYPGLDGDYAVHPYGNYDSVLTYLYYDNTSLQGRWNGRLGFSYAETNDLVYNREVLYGLGYKLGEKWGVAFEHRFDIEHDQLVLQKYELRRNLHCWEAAFTFRERRSGWDVGVEFSLAAFPGTRLRF